VFVSYLLTDVANDEDAPIKDFLPNNYSKINIKCIESPRQVTERNSKGVATNALIGLVIGAFISALVIYFIHIFDVVIRDRKKIEDHFDTPVIGVIPRYSPETKVTDEGGNTK
jgi:capsular polysaccharide biosynthesis protein